MDDTLLPDDPQTVQRLDSVACLFEWIGSMPIATRKQTWDALAECSDSVQQVVVNLLGTIKDPHTTPIERQRALTTIAGALFGNADENDAGKLKTNQAKFAQRLREVMESRRISQQELAARIGCSQPAISQMLNRNSRPQKKTILKLAEALNVQADNLWPDIEVAEHLDDIASFQQDDYVMSEAEARALRDTSRPNRPTIQARPLPTRRRT